jgi:chaperonin GroEL (HSP60 family)
MSFDERIRTKQFNPDILSRELMSKIDIGYRKILERDSALLPLPHEKLPEPTIYEHGIPASVMSVGSTILEGDGFLLETHRLTTWLKSFLSPLLGPWKMAKLISTERSLLIRTSNLRLIAKHISIKSPLGQVILGAGLNMSKTLGDHSVYTSLLATLIVDNCIKAMLKGLVNAVDCIEGIRILYKVYGNVLERSRVSTPLNDEKELVKMAKIGDSLNGEKLVDLSLKITNIIPPEILRQKAPSEIIDFRTMESISIDESEVINGLALPKEIPHQSLPSRIEDARIAILKGGLTLPDYLGRSYKFRYVWNDQEEMSKSIRDKTIFLREFVNDVLASGANVIIVEKGVDDSVLRVLIERRCMLLRGLSPPEIDELAEASGARPVPCFHDLGKDDLGYAKSVEVLKLDGKEWVFFRDCRYPRRVTVLIKGNSFTVNQDFEECLRDVITYIGVIRDSPFFVPGGGAIEIEIANQLMSMSEVSRGRVSTSLKVIAEAFEQMVGILAYNNGLDPLETVTRLKMEHWSGNNIVGVEGKILDSFDVKLAAIENAIYAANTILRIDSFISGKPRSESEIYYIKRTRGLSKEKKKEMRRDYGLESLEI